jgi:phenylalanyl-tRNA synthetase beta chain
LRFFEFGKTYHLNNESGYNESEWLSIFVTGNQPDSESWIGKNLPADIFQLKGIVSFLVSRLGIRKPGVVQKPIEDDLIIGQNWEILRKEVVSFGEIVPSLLKQIGIKNKVFYAEINWTNVQKLLATNRIKHKPLPRFPEVRRDLSLLLNSEIQYKDLESLAKKTEKKLLKKVNLFDVYQGENLPNGKKSYALSFVFQDQIKTLNEKEIDSMMKKLTIAFENQMDAEIR